MQFDWWNFGLEAVNFLILAALLQRFLYRPVRRSLDRRQEAIAGRFEDAAGERREAERLQAEAQRKRTALEEEERRMREEARGAIESERRRVLEEAQEEAERLTADVRRELDEEREAAAGEVRRAAADLAVELAARLLREARSGELPEAFLERASEELAGLPEAEREALARQLGSGAPLRIRTAPRLSDRAAARWRERLRSLFGAEGAPEFEEGEDLVAGVELRFPNAVFRYAWSDALEAARGEIAHGADAA